MRDESFTPRPIVFLLLGIGGASIGVLIYFWGTPSTSASQAFITSPEFVTWFFLNEVLFAAFPILAVLLWEPLNQLRKHFRHNRLEILVSSLILFVLFMLPHVGGMAVIKPRSLPLEYANTKMLLLMIIGFFGSLLPLTLGIWLTQAALRYIFSITPQAEYDVRDYLRLRDYLQLFLMILGALLSGFILSSAALRAAGLASGATTESQYPFVYLLIVGAYYTLLSAILYLPTYLSLGFVGQHLLDFFLALPPPDSERWAETYSDRKQLEELLELKVTGAQRFVTSIILFSPFVVSIFSLWVQMG